MDTVGVHSFIVVTRERSISRAAQALHVTQPTLSARLRKLEDDLGVTLLERSWDGIRLTTEGRFFLSYSLQLFQELEESATLLRKRDSHEADGPIEAVTNARRLRIGVESFLYPALTRSMIEGVQQVAPEAECRFVDEFCANRFISPRWRLQKRGMAHALADRLVAEQIECVSGAGEWRCAPGCRRL